MALNIVLYQPEIPQNTGNIARTCAATGSTLHLIHPLGFSTDDKYLKRAGLDYWHLVSVFHHDSWDAFLGETNGELFLVTKTAQHCYTSFHYSEDACFVFGRETSGLPASILNEYAHRCIRIPMIEQSRSLNLSNSVAIIAYEALRQLNFRGLRVSGIF